MENKNIKITIIQSSIFPKGPADNLRSSVRLSYLDSSRGIAALAVLLAHFQPTVLPQLNDSWILNTPLRIIADGEAAVLYFFILSGYVLTLSLKNSEQLSFLSYLKFITQRVFRIFPAYIFALIVSFITLQVIGGRPSTWLDRFWTTSPGIFSLFKQALLIVRLPYEPLLRIIPQDWTLTIEIAVSLLLPAIALALQKRPYMVLLFIYFAVQFLGLDPFVFDFSLGIYLASDKEEMILRWKQNKNKIPLLLISVALISADYVIPKIMNYTDLILIHHKIWGLAIILWALISSKSSQKILSIVPLTFLGKISYSFYLFHLIILLCMTVLFSALNPMPFLLLYLGITIVISTITFYLIERPFNNKAKTFFLK